MASLPKTRHPTKYKHTHNQLLAKRSKKIIINENWEEKKKREILSKKVIRLSSSWSRRADLIRYGVWCSFSVFFFSQLALLLLLLCYLSFYFIVMFRFYFGCRFQLAAVAADTFTQRHSVFISFFLFFLLSLRWWLSALISMRFISTCITMCVQ